MNKKKRWFCNRVLICYLCFIFLPQFSESQDKIYTETGFKSGKVLEITADKIKYQNPDNPGTPYSLSRAKARLLFSSDGRFLSIRQLDSLDPGTAIALINQFLNPPEKRLSPADRIYTLQKKIIQCQVTGEDDQFLTVSMNDVEFKLEKSAVAVVVYKDGTHKMLAGIETVADLLAGFQLDKPGKSLVKGKALTEVVKRDPTPVVKDPQSSGNQHSIPGSEVSSTGPQRDRTLKAAKDLADTATTAPKPKIPAKMYTRSVVAGDNFMKKNEYENARRAYLLADSLEPGNNEIQEKLSVIAQKLAEKALADLQSNTYDSLIEVAGTQLAAEDWKIWYQSKENYQKALTVKPDDSYAQKQIQYLAKQLALKEEEERTLEAARIKAEREKRFREAVSAGDLAVQGKNYEDALKAYNEALSIHPEDEYVNERQKRVAYQLSLKKSP